MSDVTSPFTGTTNVEALSRFSQSITSDSRYADGPTANCICLDTGIVFNAAGARGRTGSFYLDQYQLHRENAASEFLYFDNNQSWGFFDQIVDFIAAHVALPAHGRILDIGCGKGLLLKRFLARHPGWRASGVEPSTNAKQFLGEVLPGVDVFEGPFEESPFTSQTFNVVAVSGVVEHVPHPLEFLRSVRACLAPDGIAFVGVPNFANNAADLFTYDHLSRLTPETIAWLFAAAGLMPVASDVPAGRVPMSFVLRAADPIATMPAASVIDRSLAEARAAEQWIASVFEAYNEAAGAVRRSGGLAGFYGVGTIGLMGTLCTELTRDLVYAFFDDNHTFWNASREGMPIRPPADLTTGPVAAVALSANACYWPAIRARIATLTGGTLPVYPREHGGG